jgi:hypothetical protein
MIKAHALLCDAVDVGGSAPRVAVATQVVSAQRVEIEV